MMTSLTTYSTLSDPRVLIPSRCLRINPPHVTPVATPLPPPHPPTTPVFAATPTTPVPPHTRTPGTPPVRLGAKEVDSPLLWWFGPRSGPVEYHRRLTPSVGGCLPLGGSMMMTTSSRSLLLPFQFNTLIYWMDTSPRHEVSFYLVSPSIHNLTQIFTIILPSIDKLTRIFIYNSILI